jgi:hypothetical protein
VAQVRMTAIFASARFMSKPCTPFVLLRIGELSLPVRKSQSGCSIFQKQILAAPQAALHGHFTILDSLGHFALIEDPQACAKALAQTAAHCA